LEHVELEPLAAHAIAAGADGGMRDAQSMLDQLVAFCGSRIAEQDVLDVFGFTSHQSIGGLCGAILSGRSAEALDRVCQEAEQGRDLTRLLTDLIFHLRNLMVHQVDPEIAMRDMPPETAAMLSEQAAQISREKLLLLIDQFAEVESTMKWALNKRLYLEVGIIRATQLLGESTLSDVILALRGSLEGLPTAGLSGGGGGAVIAARGPVEVPVRKVETAAEAPVKMGSMADAVRAAVGAGRGVPVVPASVPVAAVVEKTEPVREPVKEVVRPEVAVRVPDAALWEEIRGEFSRRMPMQGAFAAEAVFLRAEGRTVVIGFPESQATASQSLMRPAAKASLERVAAEVSGQDLVFRAEVRADLVPVPLPEPTGGQARVEVPVAVPEVKVEAAAVATPEAVMAEFMDDPLIREALKVFEATVVGGK
jgi:DNA polymerase-3 subunit gamma/tau